LITFLSLCPPARARGETPELKVLLLCEVRDPAATTPAGLEPSAWLREFLCLGGLESVEVTEDREAATLAAARGRIPGYREAAPDVLLFQFPLGDALDGSPDQFLAEYERLIEEASRALPAATIILATPTPVGERHPRAGEEKFRTAGGLDGYLEKHFVEPLRQLAAKRELPLVDQYHLIRRAIEKGEQRDAIVEPDGASLTPRGQILAAQHAACWILHAVGERAGLPTVERVLASLSVERAKLEPKEQKEAPNLPLEPYRKFYEEELKTRFEARLESRDSEMRWRALEGLLDIANGRVTDDQLKLLVELSLDRDSNVRNQAARGLDRLTSGSRELAERAARLSYGMLEEEGLDSSIARSILDLLSMSIRHRNAAGGAKAPRSEAGASESFFTGDQLEFLARGLASRDRDVRQPILSLLVGEGPAALDSIFAVIRRAPERQAIGLLEGVLQREEQAGWQELFPRCVSLLEAEVRQPVRESLLARLLYHRSMEIRDTWLRELLLADDKSLRSNAAGQLVSRGQAGLEILGEGLRSADRDVQELARDGVFALVLRAESEQVARGAWKQLLASSPEGAYPSILELIEARASRVIPSSRRVITSPGRVITSPSRRLSRWSTTWQRAQVPGDLPVRRERYVLFLPFLRQVLEKGTTAEKERAEEVLTQLGHRALAEKRAAERGQIMPPRPPVRPPGRTQPLSGAELLDSIHSPKSLARLLRLRAQECYKGRDWVGYVAGMRRALAADPTQTQYADYLAWFLATTDVENLANPKEAERLCRHTIEKGSRTVGLLAGLAASLARQDRFDEAAEIQFEAVSRAEKDDKVVQLERLILYLEKRPCIVER
jgi:hypothetical protein